jgi:polyhydroxybutyrate depolymerase
MLHALARWCWTACVLLFLADHAPGQEGLEQWKLTVGGVEREALVHLPSASKTQPTPLVFAFHGHGGSAQNAARMFAMHRHWPEAIAVYMQGLNTPGRLSDPEGKRPGWQHKAGDHGDRDLQFFDALLARLQAERKLDPKRIYATGHSNGGAFTYLLWAERGDLFAAMGPSGSAAAESRPKLKPKPAMHVAGRADPLVRFAWQQATMDAIRKLNGCAVEGTPWGENATLYASEKGAPFVAYIHEGGHGFPAAAAPLLAKFFREHGK